MVEGPYGRLTSRPRTQRKVLLVGAGVGITPLRALAEARAPRPELLLELVPVLKATRAYTRLFTQELAQMLQGT